MIKLYLLYIFLIFLSYYDLCYHRLPNKLLIPFAFIGASFIPFSSNTHVLILGLFFPSLFLLLLNYIFSSYIGFGDIKLFMCLGLYLGAPLNCVLYILSTFLALICSIIRLSLKQNLNPKLPFCPFILICLLLLQFYLK